MYNSQANTDGSSSYSMCAADITSQSAYSPLGCLFNILDLSSSLQEDVPVNLKLIGYFHFEYAGQIFLTWCEHHLMKYAEDPLVFFSVFYP